MQKEEDFSTEVKKPFSFFSHKSKSHKTSHGAEYILYMIYSL